ncbi:MAG: metallophosphoesterase family protein [Phycisphaeraceae bacterium]|nr:metallophosphoesterase family protein [Phycisphaeraceae bacterium]
MPIFGLLSDSHGRAATTRRAADLLIQRGAEQLIHLGDIGTLEVLDALLAHRPGTTEQVPVHLVFGNVDWNTEELGQYARQLGFEVRHPAGTLPLAEGELAFMHGHDQAAAQQAIDRQARYLCRGHTHLVQDQMIGRTRMINPGALFRAAVYTVGLLDTSKDKLTILSVDGQEVECGNI